MDFVNCYQCGSQFSGRNVYRVDNKLKKNACAFKETFDNLNIDNPKFCRSCQKAWLRLENIRGKAAINKFISERIKEMKSKNKVNETSGGNDLNNSDQNTIQVLLETRRNILKEHQSRMLQLMSLLIKH